MRPVASCSARDVERRSSLQAAGRRRHRSQELAVPQRQQGDQKVPPATQWFAVQLRMRPPFLDPHVQLYSEHDSNVSIVLCKQCALQNMCFANHVLCKPCADKQCKQSARTFCCSASSLNTMPSDESDIEETMHDTASKHDSASKQTAGVWAGKHPGPFFT